MEEGEILKKGRNFRLLDTNELAQLLDFLTVYLPESLKVSKKFFFDKKEKINVKIFFFLFNFNSNYFDIYYTLKNKKFFNNFAKIIFLNNFYAEIFFWHVEKKILY